MSSWSHVQPIDGSWCWIRFKSLGSTWKQLSHPLKFSKAMIAGVRDTEFEFSVIANPDIPFPKFQDELKPCICGDSNIYIRQSYETEIACSNPACGWLVRAIGRNEAIMLWNRRPNP